MDYDGCRIDEFECSAGECIPLTRVCDSLEDCGDGRDEFNCSTGTCSFPKHKCFLRAQCGRFEWPIVTVGCFGNNIIAYTNPQSLTDYTDYGDYDCYEHQCSDGSCLGLNLICDGRDDCDDGSDETNCTGSNMLLAFRPGLGKFPLQLASHLYAANDLLHSISNYLQYPTPANVITGSSRMANLHTIHAITTLYSSFASITLSLSSVQCISYFGKS